MNALLAPSKTPGARHGKANFLTPTLVRQMKHAPNSNSRFGTFQCLSSYSSLRESFLDVGMGVGLISIAAGQRYEHSGDGTPLRSTGLSKIESMKRTFSRKSQAGIQP